MHHAHLLSSAHLAYLWIICDAKVIENKEKRQRRPVSRVPFPERFAQGGGHFSRAPVTRRLQRPNPRARAGNPIALLFGLAPGGVCRADAVTRAAGELLPHRFTLTALADGGLLSVALVRGVSPPGCYPAPCPVEPGLSSRRVAATGDRPAFSGAPTSIPRVSVLHRSARLDRVTRELVHPLVQRITAVAAHLVPDDVVASALGEQPLPEIPVGDGLLLPVLPAGLLPALPPTLAEAIHDVGAVRVEVDAPPPGDRGEPLDSGGELHALVRRVRLGAADDTLLAGVEDDRRPATGPRVSGAGAVGVEDDVGRGRSPGRRSGQADSCQ